MTRPVMLLDVDGVVNAMSKQAPTHVWAKHYWNTSSHTDVDSGVNYPLLWATPVVEWLTWLHEMELAEIRWHTAWQAEAQTFGKIVGLPKFEVQECPEWLKYQRNGSALAAELISACMPPWWKYPAAERVVTDEKRRLIWIDDDIDYQITRAARHGLGLVHEVLLLCPNQGMGIIDKHMSRVETKLAIWRENPHGALSSS